MFHTGTKTVLLGAALAAALVATPAMAQDAEEISQELASLDAAVKAKNEQDILASIDLLMEKSRDAAKEHKRVADALGKVVLSDLSKAQIHAAKALADLGPAGSGPLKKAANAKEIRSEEEKKEVYLAVIDSIAKTGDEDNVEFLLKLLKDKDNDVIAAVATSAKYYSRARGDVRKKIVESFVTVLEGSYGASQNNRDTTAVRKYETISTPMLQSLQELTGERIGTPTEWRKWYNENKKRKW
jgi:hypothetical protein